MFLHHAEDIKGFHHAEDSAEKAEEWADRIDDSKMIVFMIQTRDLIIDEFSGQIIDLVGGRGRIHFKQAAKDGGEGGAVFFHKGAEFRNIHGRVDPVCELNKVLGDNPGAAKVDHSLEAEPHCKKRAGDEEEHHDPAAHDILIKIGFHGFCPFAFYRRI